MAKIKQYKKEIIVGIVTLIIGMLLGYLLSSIIINKSYNKRSETITSNQEILEGYVKDDSTPSVKKSGSGICHDEASAFYSKTKTFIPFNSIEECINNGGRLPKERGV